MTFNTDVSVGDVFSLFYRLVMGTEQTKGSIMEITYCVGIAIGILGFYNHFSARNERDDPTPLHLEMRNYEQEMNNAIIKTSGNYAVLCVTNDTSAAESILKEAGF